MDKQHVFIVGCKGIPTRYGGFETFVDKMTEYMSDDIKFHVACLRSKEEYDKNNTEYEYNDAHCFTIKQRVNGSAKAVFYDIDALKYCIKFIKEHNIENAIVYILACRIGPFVGRYVRQIHRLGGKVFINPDGQEWKRSKWNGLIKKYWKISEKYMIKHGDLMVCDSMGIENIIEKEYKKYNPKTTFIAYGAEVSKSKLTLEDEKVKKWFESKGVKPNNYFLTVGRFVPENNYEIIIKEYMRADTDKDLVLITDYDTPFFEQIEKKTNFKKDKRIKFVGTVYDKELLKIIRENALAYIHGHSVGGTNPSLLEALGLTDINLVYDVVFNREVAEQGALYWDEEFGLLAQRIERVCNIEQANKEVLSREAKQRIIDYYNWENICREYHKIFVEE